MGWKKGLEPKTISGPDTLVAVLEQEHASRRFSSSSTGPARGYVRGELERLQIPYRHVQLNSLELAARAYHVLDVYLVTSRQEGGPKSVLESMAAGVPLVTTRVGQAPSLVTDGENGLLADVDDADALAAGVQRVHDDAAAPRLRDLAARRPEAHADDRLDPEVGRRCTTRVRGGRHES